MRKLATMREALARPELLGDALPGDSWRSWRTLLIALCGEPLHDSERKVFAKLTGGREREPGAMADTFLAVAGRRSGKSRAMAVLCVYLSCLCDWSDCLSLGERAVCIFLAPSERQAAIVARYATALIEHSALLSALVANKTADMLTLNNGVDMEIMAASWRRSRGPTAICIVLDECAFLASGDDSLNSDAEIVTALRPSLASTRGPLILTSSPSTFEGVVAKLHKRHFGPAGDPRVVVVQSDTKGLNPSLSDEVISRAYEDDAEAAGSEFGGAFRAPVSAFLARSVVEKAIEAGVGERCALPGVQYYAAVDVAGGTGADSFCAAIGHKQRDAGRDICVVDLVFEQRPPFDPDGTTARLCAILGLWGIRSVTGDHYASAWPVTSFARCGISYSHAPITTSEIYLHTVPLWTAGRVSLVDNQRLVDQLCGLRRKVGSAGREQVVHMGGAHDDLATAVCGLLWKLSPATRAAIVQGPIIFTASGQTVFAPGPPIGGNDPWAEYNDLVRAGGACG